MRRCRVLAVAVSVTAIWGGGAPAAAGAAVAATAGTGAAASAVVTAAGGWGTAIAVPGLGALNTGRDAAVSSISCSSAGNCAAGGDYSDASGGSHGFVASESHGRWGKAIEVPGLAALNTGGYAQVSTVSCAPTGYCAAGGYYSPAHSQQGFVAVERNGRWGNAIAVPGLQTLNTGREATVEEMSCSSAGNCVAGGYYSRGEIGRRGFVVVERNGLWGQAIEVPGLAALDTNGYSDVDSVSCAPQGNCAAGGYFTFHGGNQQGFVALERGGRWGKAIRVPGLTGPNAAVSSVSCGSADSCVAGGGYTGRRGTRHGFLAVERRGVWDKAIGVPGLGALNAGGNAEVASLSCGSAGSCAAGGGYTDRRGHYLGFVAIERHGHWGRASAVPGLSALNKGGRNVPVLSVSCAADSSCAAGGHYHSGRPSHDSWYVTVERDGRWGKAIAVPGLSALNKGAGGYEARGDYFSVSCARAARCAAGGYYTDSQGEVQGFVTQAG